MEIELFKWKGFRLPKTIYRKMGKHNAFALFVNNEIHIDSRMKGKKELELHLHELSHWALPEFTEEEVRVLSRKFTEYLWREGYRKTDNNSL
ncbi:hypothetical protein UFOVP1605_37 [uncultured Caudovirales phage]|uniref:IrrE N-terminal-like domain-containing protein n=1 Tax=uncultured Caudovirales phage TaxID=2100421 RepID=A0A6J5STH3_9CAUD|nr:hypothetical protein UFOVP1605_37 [uncultured Caudovirales phage]